MCVSIVTHALTTHRKLSSNDIKEIKEQETQQSTAKYQNCRIYIVFDSCAVVQSVFYQLRIISCACVSLNVVASIFVYNMNQACTTSIHHRILCSIIKIHYETHAAIYRTHNRVRNVAEAIEQYVYMFNWLELAVCCFFFRSFTFCQVAKPPINLHRIKQILFTIVVLFYRRLCDVSL